MTRSRRQRLVARWLRFPYAVRTIARIVAVAIGAIVLGSTAEASAQDASTATLIEQRSWANESKPLQVTAATTTDAVSGRLALHNASTSRIAFTKTLSDDPELGRVILRTAPTPTTLGSGSSASSSSREVRLELDLTSLGVSLVPGVHAIEIEFLDDSDVVIDRILTHFVRVPDALTVEQPLSVTIVVPISAADPIPAEGPIGFDDAELADLERVVEILEAHEDIAVVLAADPRTMYALSEGDTKALRVLDQVKRLAQGSAMLTRPFADIDPRSWVAAGHASELEAQLETGSAQVSGAMLTETNSSWWVGTDFLDEDVIDVLHDSGVRYIAAPSSNFVPLDEREFPVTLVEPFSLSGREHEVTAIALDEALVAATAASTDPVLATQRLVADLSVLYFDKPNRARGTVLMPTDPHGWDPSQLDLLLTALSDNPILSVIDLDTLAASVEPARLDEGAAGPGELLARTFASIPSDDLSTFPEDLLHLRARLDTYASVIGPSRPELLPLRVRSLAASSQGLTATERQRFLDGIDATITEDLANAVELPIEQQITLTARDGAIPLTIRTNKPDRTLQILVRLASDKLSFPEGEETSIAIGGADNGDVIRLDIPVKALSSGAFPLRIDVTSPDGSLVLAEAEVTVRSTAISGVGLVLSVGAGLFLVLWWARNFRRERRRAIRT